MTVPKSCQPGASHLKWCQCIQRPTAMQWWHKIKIIWVHRVSITAIQCRQANPTTGYARAIASCPRRSCVINSGPQAVGSREDGSACVSYIGCPYDGISSKICVQSCSPFMLDDDQSTWLSAFRPTQTHLGPGCIQQIHSYASHRGCERDVRIGHLACRSGCLEFASGRNSRW